MWCALFTTGLCLASLIAEGHGVSVIKSGSVARQGQFPFVVSVRYFGKHRCGGSIITETIIITAAHCFENDIVNYGGKPRINGKSWMVVAGSTSLRSGGRFYPVQTGLVHQRYFERGRTHHDLALLRTQSRIATSNFVKPISLLKRSIPSGDPLMMVGWGNVEAAGELSPVLKFAWMRRMDHGKCYRIFKSKGVSLLSSQMCVYSKQHDGMCAGDAGGPIVLQGQLAGISSWGVTCPAGMPDVASKISSFVPWIEQSIDFLEQQCTV